MDMKKSCRQRVVDQARAHGWQVTYYPTGAISLKKKTGRTMHYSTVGFRGDDGARWRSASYFRRVFNSDNTELTVDEIFGGFSSRYVERDSSEITRLCDLFGLLANAEAEPEPETRPVPPVDGRRSYSVELEVSFATTQRFDVWSDRPGITNLSTQAFCGNWIKATGKPAALRALAGEIEKFGNRGVQAQLEERLHEAAQYV